MDDHRSRKRRRRSHQEESTPPRYAPERRKPAQPADIGCDNPARQRGRDAAAAETRVRSRIEAAENGYVYNWLAEVATEQQAMQTQIAASERYDGLAPLLPQTEGLRRASLGRYDETVGNERTHREKRRDSSDSSLIQPAYEREELRLQETVIGQVTSQDRARPYSRKAKKHKQAALSTTADSQSDSDQPKRKETFEKRSRHKTREDRYESKKARKYDSEDDKPAKKKTIKVKRGDAAKASRKAGEDLINGFKSNNVAQDRLTIRPSTGIFKNGRASSPSRNRGLPDLAFSEMQFLKQSNRNPPESEKELIVSKSGQKTKRERERARNEISNYFVPVRQPLQEAGINRGREVSTLPSDAGKTEDTSLVRGHHSHPYVSPDRHPRNQNELYSGFGIGMATPQKFSLPRPKLDQIFVPRSGAEPNNASSKSTSYCTWSESVRSPLFRGKAMVTDAVWDKRGMSPPSRQRIPIRAGLYKEVGVQAEFGSEVDVPYNPAMREARGDYEDNQVVMSKQLKTANTSCARDANAQTTEFQDDDSIYQLQADRAVLHDCEPHRGSKETTVEQCTQTEVEKVGQSQDNSVPPGTTNPESDVRSIMSRAVIAQQAYIKRKSTPKVALAKVGDTSDARVLPTDLPSTIKPGDSKEHGECHEVELTDLRGENEIGHLLSGLDGRQTGYASQPRHEQSLGPMPKSNLSVYEELQNEYLHGAGHEADEPDDSWGYITGEGNFHQNEDVAASGHIEPPQLMIPTRGFSSGVVHIPQVQRRTISPLELMEPIYARQLHSQAFNAQEGHHGFQNPEEHGQSSIYLYEGGQWEREYLDVEVPQYNPIEMEDEKVHYADVYEGQQDGLDLIDESIYYEEEPPFNAEAQMHDTDTAAPPDDMLFYTPSNDSDAGYQWMPRQRTLFSAAADQASGLGSWERVQSSAVPRELTKQFWQPRRGY